MDDLVVVHRPGRPVRELHVGMCPHRKEVVGRLGAPRREDLQGRPRELEDGVDGGVARRPFAPVVVVLALFTVWL